MIDTNLNDEMVKLVRYSIVSLKRDKEKAIVSRKEKLFDDSLTDEAFASWMIAENHKRISALPKGDRKYLRVTYEVLDRWPRQDREYEKRQLDALEGIEKRIGDLGGLCSKKAKKKAKKAKRKGTAEETPEAPPADGPAFDQLTQRLASHTPRYLKLRASFRHCADELGKDVASALMENADRGHFKARKVTATELARAFKTGAAKKFDPATLDAFEGRWKGVNRRYRRGTDEEMEADAATWHMTWEKGETREDGAYYQNVIGSQTRHFGSDELPALTENQVDLALNVHNSQIGVTGWLSTFIEFRTEMTLVAYQLDDATFLWIGQVLDPNLNPMGDEKLYWMFLEWLDDEKKAYFMYGLQFLIDFDCAMATVLGDDYRKSQFDRVS